jgi:hypothetical protein
LGKKGFFFLVFKLVHELIMEAFDNSRNDNDDETNSHDNEIDFAEQEREREREKKLNTKKHTMTIYTSG